MKKIFIYVLSCMLILSCVSASFATEKTKDNTAATNKNLKPIQVLNANNYKTNRVEDITLEDIKQAQTAVSNDSEKAILFYNNGNALDCNDYISFESDDSMKLTQDEIINESDEIKNQCESMGYNYIDEGIDKSNINVFGVYIYDNQTNQKLIKYGPTGDVGKRDGYTFTLSGGGVISASFNVTFGGSYKRSDFSTISGKYGKWRYFTDTASMKNKLTTDSVIRCTNTKGNLVIKAKCQIKTMHLVGRSFHSNTYEWTPAQYSISDR